VFLRKFGATVYLLWLALYLGAPQYVHHCPEHSVVQPAPASSHDVAHGAHGEGTDQSDGRHECCCPGPQCGTGSLVVPVQASLESPAPALESARPRVRVEQPRAARDAHVLPFGTAPPARLIA
jgi:hypothetical protein